MNTLRELITIDESDFEMLVTLYLRQLDPKLKGLIQTGINAEGKPIKCPVDSVLYVPGEPPQLVHVAATTYETPGLRRKWLGGSQGKKHEPGDIKKAEEEFKLWEQKVPSATRKLYLATNRPLENNTELYRDAVARCLASNIEVEIVEASQLVAFLDHDPEGQYLRQELLGIEAGRLSESLLRQIAHHSLVQHQEKFGIPSRHGRMEIAREAEHQLMEVLAASQEPLIGLRGASGAGKSTLVRQVGVKINSEGGICLWAPAEDLTPNVSPSALLLSILRRFQPSLNEKAGDDAINIAAATPGGIVLLADDVNRLRAPHEALETARVCVRTEAQGRAGGELPRIRFVTPLWPGQFASQAAAEKSGWEIVDLSFYTAQERRLLAGAHASVWGEDLLPLLESLNGDPFLCGLALAGHAGPIAERVIDRGGLVKTIVEEVLGLAAQAAARSDRIAAAPEEFVSVLDQLIELMLRTEQPDPMWNEVRIVLGDRAAELLLVLGKTNWLGWVEQHIEGSRWRWKHDRLRDALVGRRLANRIAPRLAQDEQTEEDETLLRIPGAAEAWAWALAFASPDQRVPLIRALAECQPLALAEALTVVGFLGRDEARHALVDGLRRALQGFDPRVERFVLPPQWPVLRRLSLTDSLVVLEITEHMERNWHVCLARFRNGDTEAGLQLLKRDSLFGRFLPATRFPTLERAVEAFSRVVSSNRSEVARELSRTVSNADDAVAVLILSGYLAWGELARTAWDVWSALDEADQQATLVFIVWALSRCADGTMQGELKAALLRARKFSDEERVEGNVHHGSERHWNFVEPLRLALRWDMTAASAGTWARVASEQEDMRETFLPLLREIDQAATAEAYVRLTSKFGGFWDDQLEAQRHPGDGEDNLREHVPVTPAARERLWQIIEGDESEEIRKVAFWLWKRFPVPDDVKRLRRIDEDDPLFGEAFQVRLRLRDRTAAPLLIKLMNAEPGAWCSYSYALYYEAGVADALFNNLEAALASDPVQKQYVERLPQYLPPDGVKRLVREKHDLLLSTPHMWNPLWRSDVPEAMEFLQQAIPQADSEKLRYMFLFSGNSYPVTERRLRTMLPLLRYFSSRDRDEFTYIVLNSGLTSWAEAHGISRVVRTHKGDLNMWLNEDDALATLNEAAQSVPQGVRQIEHTDNFHEIRRQGKKVSFDTKAVLRRWLGRPPDTNQLTVAAMVLSSIGVADDTEWWRELEPEKNGAAYEAWSNTLYVLRRRRWQKHDPQ